MLKGFLIFDITSCINQPENASFPMLVTLLGIVMEVKLMQPVKAHDPMLVTLLPIDTKVRLLQ